MTTKMNTINASPLQILKSAKNKEVSNEIISFLRKYKETFEFVETPEIIIKKRHIHFALNSKDDLIHIKSILEDNGFILERKAFLDMFFDTPDLQLMKSNQWLQCRDGVWSLKSVELQSLGVFFRLTEGNENVLLELKDKKKYTEYDLSNSYFKESASTVSKCFRNCLSEIQKIFPRRIACFPTNRLSFFNKSNDIEISIDTIKAKDEDIFYSIGHVKLSYDCDKENLILSLIGDYIKIPSRSKVITYLLKRDLKDDITEVLQNIIKDECCDYHESSFQIDSEPLIPYEKLDSITLIAINSELSLKTAYNVLLEEEMDRKFLSESDEDEDEDDQ